jgi:chitin disaccharide deacetylase
VRAMILWAGPRPARGSQPRYHLVAAVVNSYAQQATSLKRLIINADDFGFSPDVNAGIVHAHRQGVLTSTTLMATGDAFEDAVRLASETPTLDIGCHLVLVQGRSLITGRKFPEGPPGLVVALLKNEIDVYSELKAQVEKILAAGVRPTHLDSHKHTHILPHVFRVVGRLAHEFDIPYVRLPLDTTLPIPRSFRDGLRNYYQRQTQQYRIKMTDHFLGFRLTGFLTEQTFSAALAAVPQGATEFMCHPGFLGPDLMNAATRLKESRVRELAVLISPRIRQLISEQGLELTNFAKS